MQIGFRISILGAQPNKVADMELQTASPSQSQASPDCRALQQQVRLRDKFPSSPSSRQQQILLSQ